jgi:large subunit ribosomal protein L4
VQLPVHDLTGAVVGEISLPDLVFGIEPNHAVMHQALVRQLANARVGTHNTLTRANVSGGGRKPWRQKGTGRARQGSIRSPQWRGGGVVFGPHPRSYKQRMPRKMRRLAIRCGLSQKVREGRLRVVIGLEALEPRTRSMMAALEANQAGDGKALIATLARQENAERAAGNLERVRLMRASNLGIADLLKYDHLLLEQAAVAPLAENLLKGARMVEPAEFVVTPASGDDAFLVTARPSAQEVSDE